MKLILFIKVYVKFYSKLGWYKLKFYATKSKKIIATVVNEKSMYLYIVSYTHYDLWSVVTLWSVTTKNIMFYFV